MDFGHSSLLGEVGISYARSKDQVDRVTSAILGAQIDQEIRLSTLSIDLGFKYRLDALGETGSFLRRIQPYTRLGLGFQVFIADSDSIALGQVPLAQELKDRGIPVGWGDIYPALNLGVGSEFMLTRNTFLGIDLGHYANWRDNGSSSSLSLSLGLRF